MTINMNAIYNPHNNGFFQMPRVSPTQLHWPDLDADIEIDALEQPEHYPMVWGDG